MSQRPPLQFKVATENWELELVHQLNYKTFVEEIPQHEPGATPRLVDKFHAENTYLICLSGNQLVGMMAVRGRRPFSLDQKLPDLDRHLPPGHRPCEVRLLAVEKEFRTGQVFQGLIALIWQYFTENGYDLGVISGTTRQRKLYRHLGFSPFGPLVGKGDAMFQPMYCPLEAFEKKAEDFLRNSPPRSEGPVNFLPGPVAIHNDVRKVFEQPPESHRGDTFVAEFQLTRQRLCQLTGAKNVEILLGSGTLANDAIGAQLSLEKGPGLILTNGEFGERLVDQAHRFGLTFDTLQFPWGQVFDLCAIEHFIARSSALKWVWCVHCETSTSMLNDLAVLKQLCAERHLKLCADCISSIGLVPVNLEGLYLASGASGKGLASFPGLSLVFYNHELQPSPKRLPRYLDLALYAKSQGIAFTHSSNLVHALNAAVQRVEWPKKFSELVQTSRWLRGRLRELGFELITPDCEAAPGVVTIAMPPELSSARIGLQLEQANYLISYNSEYLRRRNWIQICLMGEHSRIKLNGLLNGLKKVCSSQPQTSSKIHQPA
jgi:aspartate aminotransferase-like enzyme